jgi:two-component SAPR family response regulator
MIDPMRRYIRLTEDIALNFEPKVCDFSDFMRFARENKVITAANAEAAAHILELCRGQLLEKESFEWVSESCYEIDAEYERIAQGLGSCCFAAGRLQKAEWSLNLLLRRNPLCEEAHTLMFDIALQSDSLEAYMERYEQYARVMKKDLHMKPKQYYREKYEALKQL